MPSPNPRTVKALLGVSAAVLVAGVALAVAKPGELGDEEAGTAAPGDSTTTTASTLPTSATTGGTVTVTVPPVTSPTTARSGGVISTTSTTVAGGLGGTGAPRAEDGSANTGAESLLGPGMALLAAGGALRSALRRRR